MGFAQPGQILVSRSYHEVVSHISESYTKLFSYEGSRTDKNVREHEVYSVGYTSTRGSGIRSPAERALVSTQEGKRQASSATVATGTGALPWLARLEPWLNNRTIAFGTATLSLGAFTLANSAVGITGNVIGINTATISGVDILTSGNQNGITPTSPQRITDSVATLTWVNIVLNGGRIRILNQLGAEQLNSTTDATILLPKASTGTWTYKIAKYGSQPIFGSFSVDGVFKTIAPSYIPDSAVVASLAVVSAYTSLDTSQKVYDYYSLYLTTAAGILETKSVSLTPAILNLGAYSLTAGAIAANATTIATGSAGISGVNVTTTGSISGIAPAYPQQLASSAGTTNWLRITPTTGQVYRDSVNTTYSATASTTLLPATFTSAITIYVTRRGYKKQVVTVPYATTLLAAQAFFLIPDSNVVDLTTDLSTVDLTTAQLIYDAFSQYQASLVGIADVYIPAKSPGALDFGIKGFTLLTDTDFSVSPLQIKSAGLASDTYYSQSNFTSGIATIADAVLIRAANLNSELKFTPDTVTFYPSQTTRDSGTSPGLTVSGGTYRVLYGSTVNGVVMSGTVYVRVTVGVVTFFSEIPLISGANVLDLGVQGQLTVLSGKMNNLPDAVWGVPLDGVIPAKKLLVTTTAALAGKATGGGTDTITFRNLSDTSTAAIMTVDANGNRSAVTIAP